MPELPEVETIVRDLAPRLAGSRLSSPRIHKTDVLRGISRGRMLRLLDGARIRCVTRRAKHAVLELDSGHRLVFQPGMTGSLLIYPGRLTAEQRRYAVLETGIGGREKLVYRDVRRIGTIRLLDERGWASYTDRIGPEPVDPDFDPVELAARISGSRQAIKKVLMDQRRIAGVGNIYASEALFRARIDPSRPASHLGTPETERLHRALKEVLTDAIAARGTTVRDYRTGTGGSGSFQSLLQVYGRAGEPCVRCGTPLAETHAIDARQTVFCWRCQS